MRLIDADALLAILEEEEKGLETLEFQLAAVACINHIKEAPTVDAVPLEDYQSMEATCVKLQKAIADTPQVVRCKDCEWWTKQEKSIQGRCALHGIYPTGGWYCGNGERKEDEAD